MQGKTLGPNEALEPQQFRQSHMRVVPAVTDTEKGTASATLPHQSIVNVSMPNLKCNKVFTNSPLRPSLWLPSPLLLEFDTPLDVKTSRELSSVLAAIC